MRILLDNCVPYRAKQLFPGHAVSHTADIGWEALRNGALIAQAAGRFDLMVTTDKNIRHEHHLPDLPIPIVELNTRLTRFDDLKTLAPHLPAALAAAADYRFVRIAADGTLETLAPRPKTPPSPP